MNADRTTTEAYPALDKRAEAAAWLARLRGPDRTAEVERGFQRWLRVNPEHRRAFELLTGRLEALEHLRTRSFSWSWRARGVRRTTAWRIAAGIVAMLAVATSALVLYPRYAGIATAVGEQRMLTLPDGTHVYLNTDTRVIVDYDEQQRRVELKSGEALFEVAKNPQRPFIVAAGDRQITALGTTFVVRRDPHALSVMLMEGKVAVASATLMPGQRLTLKSDEAPRLDTPAPDKVIAWRQGQVALEDVPLADAVVEMNRYSTTRLVIEQPEAGVVRVGGFFRMGDSASFARAVASTYGLEVIERPKEIVLAGVPRQLR